MKLKGLIASYILFLITMVIAMTFCVIYSHSILPIGFGLLAIILSINTQRIWLDNVHYLLIKSEKALFRQTSTFKSSLKSLKELNRNHDLIANKFIISAQLIANIVQQDAKHANPFCAEDPISKALAKINSEIETLKTEEDKRKWIAQGLETFAELLRRKIAFKEYGNSIISALVKYIVANQAGLYVQRADGQGNKYLELISCYAYGRDRHLEKNVYAGEGLLGQCMLEQDFIFISDIPADFVKITSGLGEATPRNVVIAPLVFNGEFCGVIEIASFTIMEAYKIDFIKKVCGNIAAEIISLNISKGTEKLLEESNELAQKLRSREEDMRQNIEDLAATQEAMSRKQIELSGIMSAIDATLGVVELDTAGQIIRHNLVFQEFVGYNGEQLKNKGFALLTGEVESSRWRDILDGGVKSGDFKTSDKNGMEIWLSITFTRVLNHAKDVEKILCMLQNITQKKVREKEFERLSLVANNTDSAVIITDQDGLIEYVNDGFVKMTGYSQSEVMGKKPGVILQGPLTDKATVSKIGQQIRSGIPVYEEILNYNKTKQTYWVSLAINPVKDDNGVIHRFISIQSDITGTKIQALDFHQKMAALSRSNAIIEVDKQGNLIDINENYLSALGYDREELIGKPYSILTREDGTFQKVINTIGEKGLQEGVFSRYDKQGKKHSMKLTDYPVLNILGDLEKVIEFVVDVSNEKRLEKEAGRRQAELEGYLKAVNNTIASAEFSADGEFRDANEIFLTVLGWRKEDLKHKSFLDLMGSEASTIMMWENLKLGKLFSGEFKMIDSSGKELWLNGTFNPVAVDTDGPEKILMLAQFTTQEKEKLNDLQSMVHAFKATLPVLEFNVDFSCKTANEKAMKLFRLTRIELKTKTILDFIDHDFHEVWKSRKNEIMDQEFYSTTIPFIVENRKSTYEVEIAIVKSINGSIAKIIVLLVKEVSAQASVSVPVK